MKVALLEIENFRGIKKGKIKFRDHTVLIGPNNSGKTTIIEALALVLGRERLVRELTEHDFFGSNPSAMDRIRIVATIADFPGNDLAHNSDWFRDGRAVPLWLNQEDASVLPTKTTDHQILACQIAFVARFDRDSLDVETARYFNDFADVDIFTEESFISVPSHLIRDIGLFLIPATRSWDRMLSFSSELFKRVIRSADGLPAETILEERDRLRKPEHRLEDHPRLKPVVDAVNKEIANVLGSTAKLNLRLTATDSASVLEAVTAHFEVHGPVPIPSKRQGSGLVSLQTLFLLLHFGQKRIADGESFLMALEEPELHLPPAIQRRVLTRLQALSTQTIISTHSPLVATYCDATSVLLIRNTSGVLSARPLLEHPLGQDATNAIRRLLQINRIETVAAVMNELLVVPEGRFDFDWLTLLLRVVELDSSNNAPCLFGVRVGVVPTVDAKIKETCRKLGQVHPNVIALVDGDVDGKRYADELDAPNSGASRVVRWPDNWTIEDLIGWIIKADEQPVFKRLGEDLSNAPIDLVTLVARLKTKDHTQNGLKGDIVAYEAIANAISESKPCCARARDVLHDFSKACAGEQNKLFVVEVREATQIQRLVFTP